jgi:hypothetical protein
LNNVHVTELIQIQRHYFPRYYVDVPRLALVHLVILSESSPVLPHSRNASLAEHLIELQILKHVCISKLLCSEWQ